MKFVSTLKLKLIYVFRINDAKHKGCLKVGEATATDEENLWGLEPSSKGLNQAAKKRINQYTQTAGIEYDLLYTELSVFTKKGAIYSLNDNEVHQVLTRSGISRKQFDTKNRANEWFVTDLETVKQAIKAAKEGRKSLHASQVTTQQSPIVFRPEQKEAITRTQKQFKKSNQFLWNAKMRFGKTLSAMQVVKEMELKRTLILTHRPVVDAGWFEDFGKIFYDKPHYLYGSKNNGENFETAEHQAVHHAKHYLYFASVQDLRGSELVGGNFNKNDKLFATPWELIIIDEAHEGMNTDLGKAVLSELIKEHTKLLRLSGTPFNLFDEYKEEEIYTWDYVMEQQAKKQWDEVHLGDPNPYAGLPRLNIFTYDLGKLLTNYCDSELAFNFREFFRVDDSAGSGAFLHQSDVISFLNIISKPDADSHYPYATQEYRNNFRHTLWVIPGVKEAKALSSLLQQHPIFQHFKIVNVAGDGDEEERYDDALKAVNQAIGDKPEESYTITLSCGRLTTGVSVKPWTAVLMLSGSVNTAASTYMQTIFRVQTPAVIGGKVKEECYVFDFAPDRTLKVIAEAAKISAKAGKTTGDDRQMMGEFLNFCPIIAVDGSQMRAYDTNRMLEQLKKVYVERVVKNGFEDGYLYSEQLLKLDEIELKEFAELKKIVGATKAMPKSGDIDLNEQGFTHEEYEQAHEAEKKQRKKEELTEAEKELLAKKSEKKKNRDSAISILRGISIRMPLLIYGAELKSENEEITIDNFTSLIDPQSWEEFMPKGVSKQLFNSFKKYYDPDIFCAAGKRIRAMAKAADSLSVEERIERIATIFGSFRNPDKETVLTPWRVVNMHIVDCMGGYTFFDEARKEMIAQPRLVEQGEVTKEVFGADTRILEINSKSGLYPLYMAYSVYRNRLSELTPEEAQTDKGKLCVWDRVLQENIFVLCKTPMAKSITKRTLAGFRSVKVNTRHFEDLINQITNKTDNFLVKITNGKGYWKANEETEMKFKAIVGNPPYQVTKEDTSDSPIYHLFMDIAFRMSDKVSFITPGRFLFNAGKTPKKWNEKILNDKHFKVVWYASKSTDVFPNVDIKGGVAVTFRDAKQDFGKIGTYMTYPELNTIVNKVLAAHFVSLKESVFAPESYKFNKLIHDKYPSVASRLSKGHLYDITSNIFEKLPEFFYDDKPLDGKDYIQLVGREDNSRFYKWICKDYIAPHLNLDYYKVILPKANGSGTLGETLSAPFVGTPMLGHTQTFISIGAFKTEIEATSVLKYVKTKFARLLLGTLKITQDNKKATWANVPLQDFTLSSDIDWSKSVREIDTQLYVKYGLSEEEIDFIESMIKGME